MITEFFKSLIDQDTAEVVICSTAHTIVYMNPAACRHYARFGGEALVGKNLLCCHNERSQAMILQVLDWFGKSVSHNRVHTFYSEKENKDVYMVALRNASGELIGYYEKHEVRARDMTPLYQMD